MGFGRRIGDPLRVPGRGVRSAVAVLVVLTLAAATGSAVSLTAPDLVKRLGLGTPEAGFTPARPVPVLGPLPADAPVPSPAGLAAVLDRPADAPGTGRLTGVVVDPATGSVLWERSPAEPMVPGSTAKIATAAAALLTLDPTHRLVTRVVAGEQPGTVVLVGGGDPTLTALPAGREGVYPEPARLVELAAEVRDAAPGPVRRVLVDLSRYRGPTLARGWSPADVPGGFVAPIEPLMLDGGRLDPAVQDGARTTEPALAAGRALARLLDADPDAVAEGAVPAEPRVLGAVSSAPLAVLVEHVMRSSDNVLAEVLAREVAIARGGEASFAGATTEVLAALAQAGIATDGAALSDGSGLSTEDRMTARLLGSLLSAAAAPPQDARDTEFLRPLLTGLPVAGGDGTLDDRFVAGGAAADGRGTVRAKTGTLTEVSSLAGVVTAADGRLLVFAFLSNGASPATARPRLDALAAALAGCGCR